MKEIVLTILGYISIVFLFFLIGFFVELGKSMATKYKKVCDICFRDIERFKKAIDGYKHNISK